MQRMPVGIDIAKAVFQVHYVDGETGEIVNKPIKRAKFLEYFVNRAPCLIGMEACGGAQHWARAAEQDGTPGKTDPCGVCQGVQHPQQERCGGRTGDLAGRAATGQDRSRSRPKHSRRCWRCTGCGSSW